MPSQGRWCGVFGRWLVAMGLLSSVGCLSFCHPIDPAARQPAVLENVFPGCCCNHVYIFFVDGLDPLDIANFEGVHDYLHTLGFRKLYYGQLFHASWYNKEIHTIHQEDPSARFVLIGFSFGANVVRSLANSAGADGIPIDLLVYLGGNTLGNEDYDQPENVARIVNILAHGYLLNGAHMDRATNISEEDVYHFGSPTHPRTLEVLRKELAEVASHVEVVETLPEAPLPVPAEPGEWDFLKPTSHLSLVK